MTREWDAGTPDAALTAIAHTDRLLVALDFDGVVSELVVDAMSARPLPETAAAIGRLAALPGTEVAYVSGRSLEHLLIITEHDENSGIALAGSHGAQLWLPGEGEIDLDDPAEDRALRESLWAELEPLLDAYPQVWLERKTFGLGIHGRAADPAVETRAFAAVDEVMASRAPHWRRRTGHHILEFSSRHESKDVAIATLRDRFGATGVLFAGDDVTDEDALRSLGEHDMGVRVGPGETAATLRVQNPRHFAELLAVVADERSTGQE